MMRYGIIAAMLLACQACSGAFQLSKPAVKSLHGGLTTISIGSSKISEFVARVCLPVAILPELKDPCDKVIEYKDPADEALQLIIDTVSDLYIEEDAATGGDGE